ncbi:MAG: hypothetical protein K8R34_13125 [Methanosarcinales archaeon]|nr:hypothetical protein [Methanosarcinales archaeon]
MTRLLLVAVLMLAAAGVGAGTPIQDAINGAGGDTIYVHAGTYVENMDMRNSSGWLAMVQELRLQIFIWISKSIDSR